jgi:hypothetical protein
MYDAAQERTWTAGEVGERLKAAFAEHFGSGLANHRERRGDFVEARSGMKLRAGQFIKRVQGILGRGEDCEMLFAWARSQAGIGASLRETCRIRGWSVSTVYHRRQRACEKLAAALVELVDGGEGSRCGKSHQSLRQFGCSAGVTASTARHDG